MLLFVLEKNQGGTPESSRSHMDMDSGVPASTRTTSFSLLVVMPTHREGADYHSRRREVQGEVRLGRS